MRAEVYSKIQTDFKWGGSCESESCLAEHECPLTLEWCQQLEFQTLFLSSFVLVLFMTNILSCRGELLEYKNGVCFYFLQFAQIQIIFSDAHALSIYSMYFGIDGAGNSFHLIKL